MNTLLFLILAALNILILIFLFVDQFRKNYTIVDLETWNTIATFYNKEHDEDNNCGGGVGFFRECLYTEDDNNEDEDERMTLS